MALIDLIFSYWFVVAALVPLIFFVFFYKQHKNIPPGPRAWPLIGNLLDLGANPHISLTNLARKNGNMFRFYFSSYLCIVLSDYDSIKKAFANEAMTGRMKGTIIDVFTNGKGLIMSDGELWKEHRRFALSTLRDLGMGRSWIQEKVLEEVELICSVLKKEGQVPYDPEHLITAGVSNIICAAVFGKRFSHEDKKFKKLLQVLKDSLKSFGQANLIVLFPSLRYFPYFRGQFKKMAVEDEFFFDFIGNMINEARNSGTQAEETSDYVNAFLRVAEKSDDPETTFESEQLKISVGNMFVAGTETTSSSLLLSFLHMVENPNILAKIQQEIDSVVRPDEYVRMEHRGKLPWTEAAILELLRIQPVAPLGVFHRATENTTLNGYNIPKNTLVISNLYAVHHDPKLFEDPEQFNPGRFIDMKGNFVKSNLVIPFAVGRRACLGESLAQMELFLIFANILHKFTPEIPYQTVVSSKNVHVAVTMNPNPFKLIFRCR